MLDLVNYLNESLRQHISVELDQCMFEKHGSYDGIDFHSWAIYKKIEDFIARRSNNDYMFHFSTNKDFPNKNTFYENVIIHLHNVKDIVQCSYNALSGMTYGNGNDKDKLMCIDLHINVPFHAIMNGDAEYELTKQLSHELTHAYEDYNLMKSGKGGLSKLFDNEYKKAAINVNDSLANAYKYFFSEPEKNSHITELREQIRKDARKLNMYDENASEKILDLVKCTSIYRKYISLITTIDNLKEDDKDVKDIMKLKDFDGMTPNKIIKKLKDDALKLKNKLEKIIAKTVCDCLEVEIPLRGV